MMDRIIRFFKKLFSKNKYKYLDEPLEVETKDTDNFQAKKDINFKSQMKASSDIEEEKASKLQKDYKAGLIEEEDLSEEDFDLLSNLYETQIEQTKQSIESYKKKILNIKNKLVVNN